MISENNMLKDINKLNNFIKERNKFSGKTFGNKRVRGPIHPLKKMQEELIELIENPKDKSEWADVTLCLFDAAWRAGYSFEDLLNFSIKKLNINKTRKWKVKSNGQFQHI